MVLWLFLPLLMTPVYRTQGFFNPPESHDLDHGDEPQGGKPKLQAEVPQTARTENDPDSLSKDKKGSDSASKDRVARE